MDRWRRLTAAMLAAGLLMLAMGPGTWAEADKAATLSRKDLDTAIYKNLRDVINQGADLYNAGDTAGCYRLYEGALLAIRPLLDHRPELQKAIGEALENARNNPAQFQRAFVLRAAIDRTRDTLRVSMPSPTKAPARAKKPTLPAPTTLWQRLGGEDKVTKVVDDFVARATHDSRVNFVRGGKHPLDGPGTDKLKHMLVQLISSASGGPLTYTGRNMKEVHKGMGITDVEFDALAADLQAALKKYGAQPDDIRDLMDVVVSVKKDIVENKPAARTVWESLGGDKGVTRVVDDFVAVAVADRKVNFTRGDKYKLTDAAVAELKKNLVDLISSQTGGPRRYSGKSMKEAHRGMGITDAEFDAIAADLRAALQKNGAMNSDIEAVMRAVESSRHLIVEPKSNTGATRNKTLWERIGGMEKVIKIVDDFAATAGTDPRVNFSRGDKFKLDRAEQIALKKKLVDMISQAAGGPFKYKGKKMKDAHEGMGITDAEFNVHSALFKEALEKNHVDPDDIKELLAAFESTRKDIVEKPAK